MLNDIAHQEHLSVPISSAMQVWLRPTLILVSCLALIACGSTPEHPGTAGKSQYGTWGGVLIGAPPAPNPRLRQAIISRAMQEWEFFDRQIVVFKGSEESIPHVGAWEDDGIRQSSRVNTYWRAAGQPALNGMDCQEPWSAAFISWIMQSAGVPEYQFPRSPSHSVYLASLIEQADMPDRWFVPRRITDYSPKPGDLICAYRGQSRPRMSNGYTSAPALDGIKSHCDLVVAKNPRTLEVIGGNVRNSVSRTTLEVDSQGHIQPTPRRPWFLVMENRL